jgi:hypothetical protein
MPLEPSARDAPHDLDIFLASSALFTHSRLAITNSTPPSWSVTAPSS